MSQFLCGINIPEHVFDVAIAGDRDAFPDLSSLSKIFFFFFSHVLISDVVEKKVLKQFSIP